MKLFNGEFSLQLKQQDGKTSLEFNHLVTPDCVLIEGKPDQPYVIELNNQSIRTLFCIVSVEGVSIVSGEPASRRENEGLIVGPFQRIVLDQYFFEPQKSFRFTYAKETEVSVMGKIGVAFYLIGNDGSETTLVDARQHQSGEWKTTTLYRLIKLETVATIYYFKKALPSTLEAPLNSVLPSPFLGD
jgi:hypothetical protein